MRIILSIVICIFGWCCHHVSTAQRSNPAHEFSTPHKALSTYENHMDREDYASASEIFNDSTADRDQLKTYARKFKQVLEGEGIILFINDAPKDPNYYDSTTQDYRYVISDRYPKIHLKRQEGKWQFQPKSIDQIEKIHQDIFKFDTDLLISQELKETSLGGKVFGLRYWQILAILCLIIASIFIRLTFAYFFERALMRALKKFNRIGTKSKQVIAITKPIGMICVLIFIRTFYPLLELPHTIGYYVIICLKILIPLYGFVALYRFIDILEIFMIKWVSQTENKLDDQLVPLLKKTLRVLIIVFGVLITLDSINVPILPLLTGLSIGGLAFALAAQDTIKNFFGSLMIFVDKPFQIGDWITSGDIDGTVEEVGFRSTRVRTFRNSLVSVPNGQLADSTIDNHGLRQFRRYRSIIAVKYDTPPERIEVFVEGLKKLLMNHPNTNKEKFEIHLNNMNDSSLDILFYIFFEAPTWSDELKFRQEIILEILKLGRALSVHFAFPTQTLHVENLPGRSSLSPEYTLTKEDLQERLNKYFQNKVT